MPLQSRPEALRYQPELDGVRGVAILAVLLCHLFVNLDLFPKDRLSWILRHLSLPGWWGVDLFFALSGFLITGILLRTRTAKNYYQSFYARRILRIFPLYYFVLTVVFVAAHFVHWLHTIVPLQTSDRVLTYFYLQTWPFFWNQYSPPNVLGPYWSLAVEEQFYLVWPFLVATLSPKWIERVCLIGFLGGTPFRLLLSHFLFGASPLLLVTPVTRLDGLFTGAFVAVYTFRRRRPVPRRWARAAFWTGVSVVIAITIGTHGRELVVSGPWMRTIGVTAIALASAALIAYSQHHPPALQRFLVLKPLRRLGQYSYGLYVYHLLLYIVLDRAILAMQQRWQRSLSFFEALVVSAACLAMCYFFAKLSFEVFEKRFIALKAHFPVRLPETVDDPERARIEERREARA